MTPNADTLMQRLAAGRLPLNDALRCASQIVDAMRHAHEEGYFHGALTPDAVILTATGVELVPAKAGAAGEVTAYTAPERLAGHAPDARTDIFSLGALLYEMFTGRRAFPGYSPEELAESLENFTPEPIGDTGLDRLILTCLAKDPASRWQRVQQVQMEFRILVFSARRVQVAVLPRQPDHALQAELRNFSTQLPLLESRMASRLEQQYAETTAALRHVAAELPLMESHLASRLEERYGEAAAGLQHLAAEVPLLESRLTSRLERHEGALAGMRQAAADLPQLESRLTSRLERYEGALAGMQQAAADLPQLESRLASRLEQHEGRLARMQQAAAELPQLESRLVSRLERHEGTLAGMQQAAAELPQLESRLASRLEQHEGTLAGMQQAVADLPQLESRLASRLERQNAVVETLQQVGAEQKSMLETISQSVNTVQEQMTSLEPRLAAACERAEHAAREIVEGGHHEAAGTQASLLGEMHALGVTVQSHAAAIESIRASMARTDDFMERVVEALESLQTMVLEHSRDRAVA